MEMLTGDPSSSAWLSWTTSPQHLFSSIQDVRAVRMLFFTRKWLKTFFCVIRHFVKSTSLTHICFFWTHLSFSKMSFSHKHYGQWVSPNFPFSVYISHWWANCKSVGLFTGTLQPQFSVAEQQAPMVTVEVRRAEFLNFLCDQEFGRKLVMAIRLYFPFYSADDASSSGWLWPVPSLILGQRFETDPFLGKEHYLVRKSLALLESAVGNCFGMEIQWRARGFSKGPGWKLPRPRRLSVGSCEPHWRDIPSLRFATMAALEFVSASVLAFPASSLIFFVRLLRNMPSRRLFAWFICSKNFEISQKPNICFCVWAHDSPQSRTVHIQLEMLFQHRFLFSTGFRIKIAHGGWRTIILPPIMTRRWFIAFTCKPLTVAIHHVFGMSPKFPCCPLFEVFTCRFICCCF